MRRPEECGSMAELRAEIDRIDEGLVALLVERVDIGTDGLNVRLRTDGLAALAREMGAEVGAAA